MLIFRGCLALGLAVHYDWVTPMAGGHPVRLGWANGIQGAETPRMASFWVRSHARRDPEL
jgi:hypothetical protein